MRRRVCILGSADDQRRLHGALQQRVLTDRAIVVEPEAVVTPEHDDRQLNAACIDEQRHSHGQTGCGSGSVEEITRYYPKPGRASWAKPYS